MNLQPLYEKIVIELESKQELKSSSGLTYHKNMSISGNTTMKGRVVAVGEGRLLSDGTIVPLKVKIGDVVVFSKIQGESYSDSEHEYTILSESNILAVLNEGENTDESN